MDMLVYVVAGLLTFGRRYNVVKVERFERVEHLICCAACGAIWPLYWAGRGAIAITKPSEKRS